MRMCIQTRKKFSKNELARFVIDPESDFFTLDKEKKIRSRGANLSLDLEVYDQAVRSGAFDRALGKKISEKEYESVRKEFEEYVRREKLKDGRKNVNLRVKGNKIELS